MQIVSVTGELQTAIYIPIISVVLVARRGKRLQINISYVAEGQLIEG